ncbi:hypothetical protein AVEN_34857-1 [Araneus ventricosus]|uniref:Uncharacterized protein n=1 Tax=Araneus ventricosus TaxID=182803 RepID=A0A4Y2WAF1_ARAVE|nr:hypothetical protein AVEN_34857-1 [Araneus ventricosus]
MRRENERYHAPVPVPQAKSLVDDGVQEIEFQLAPLAVAKDSAKVTTLLSLHDCLKSNVRRETKETMLRCRFQVTNDDGVQETEFQPGLTLSLSD